MLKARLIVLVIGTFCAGPCTAELIFSDFFDFEPIQRVDFGYAEDLPKVKTVFLRSEVGDTFTGLKVGIDSPDYSVLAHSCRSALAQGTSCMLFVGLDLHGRSQAAPGAVFRARLTATSNEATSHLELAAHLNRAHCRPFPKPREVACPTPDQNEQPD